jgi:ribosomal silencing factor RsfS
MSLALIIYWKEEEEEEEEEEGNTTHIFVVLQARFVIVHVLATFWN